MTAKGAGRSTRRWRVLKAEFRRKCKQRRAPCWLCGQPIDYTLVHPHPEAFEPDHYHPVAKRPELAEDPANLRPSHSSCNRSRGDREVVLGLGRQSRQW
ncbi:HNH endonuclease [Gordonia phage TinaLin]|uniref:HNH endonuclease n=1 Tax=Gordonia phage TinaLin TaxID=2797324 RepID=A0A7T7K7Z9_9CAUD|nr:HNH endonuclease [Gordonia phage TinaLin]QQM15151.1 HNH endonuclease [Gordonia phage TinaLin]